MGTGWPRAPTPTPEEGLQARRPGPGTRWHGPQPPARRATRESRPPAEGGGSAATEGRVKRCQRPGRGNLAVGARGQSRSKHTLPPKSPAPSGKGGPALVLGEAEGTSGRKGGEQTRRAPASVSPTGSRSGQGPAGTTAAKPAPPRTRRPFPRGSAEGQGLLRAKEKRNLPAEYFFFFLDILQDARPP